VRLLRDEKDCVGHSQIRLREVASLWRGVPLDVRVLLDVISILP
jgi:hypothetical protein